MGPRDQTDGLKRAQQWWPHHDLPSMTGTSMIIWTTEPRLDIKPMRSALVQVEMSKKSFLMQGPFIGSTEICEIALNLSSYYFFDLPHSVIYNECLSKRCWGNSTVSRIILCMRPADERRRCNVTSSPIGWAKWSLSTVLQPYHPEFFQNLPRAHFTDMD